MTSKLADNEYGFSVAENNPFHVFQYLQKEVIPHFKPSEVLDLSRGNPGLGFSPSEHGRKFFAFLMTIDTVLNSNLNPYRIHSKTRKDLETIKSMIKTCAEENYQENVAKEHLKTLDEVTERIQKKLKKKGKL